MKPYLLALSLLLLPAPPANAALTESALSEVGLSLPANAHIPLYLSFRDETGRAVTFGEALGKHPALLVPVDYTCKSICGSALTIAADALRETGLKPNADYRLIVVGIDPMDGVADMRAMAARNIHDNSSAARASVFLQGDKATTTAFLRAIGYRTAYDPERDQFAHPAVALTVTKDGRISHALSSLALVPGDLRLAVVEAGEGETGSIGDRLRSICYGFDAVHGIYTPLIHRLLAIVGLTTMASLGAMIFVMSGVARRHR